MSDPGLHIFFGYGCNLRCGYCLQPKNSHTAVRSKGDAVDFVDKVAPFVARNNIRHLHLWGGEPLLYWDHIIAVLDGFSKRGLTFDLIRITTNGTMLTPEHAFVLNQMGAFVVVSAHLDQQDPAWDSVALLEQASIHFLFSRTCLTAWKWFELLDGLEQRYGRPFFPFADWIKATETTPERYWLTMKDLETHGAHLEELGNLYIAGHRHAFGVLDHHYRQWQQGLVATGDVQALCYTDDHISVDLWGERYACHHTIDSAWKTGSIWQEGRTPEERACVNIARRFITSSQCSACPLRRWCRGNCHRSVTHEVDCTLKFRQARVFERILAASSKKP